MSAYVSRCGCLSGVCVRHQWQSRLAFGHQPIHYLCQQDTIAHDRFAFGHRLVLGLFSELLGKWLAFFQQAHCVVSFINVKHTLPFGRVGRGWLLDGSINSSTGKDNGNGEFSSWSRHRRHFVVVVTGLLHRCLCQCRWQSRRSCLLSCRHHRCRTDRAWLRMQPLKDGGIHD